MKISKGSKFLKEVEEILKEELERARKLLEPEIKELQFALLDLLSGNETAQDIRYFTGLSEERCIEISDLGKKIFKDVGDEFTNRRSKK